MTKPSRAIILLGGLGTRLRPFTLSQPKPLIPILDRPFLFYQLHELKRYGVREVILALGHKAAHFRRFLGDGRAWGVKFIYSLEKEPLGTGGAIRNAERWVRGPTLVMNGDILSDLDLGALAAFHARRKAEATVAMVSVPDPSSYGLIETEKDGRIRFFLEKPSPDKVTTDTINAGCYLFEPSVFREIPAGRAVSVEREVFPALLKKGRRLFGYRHRGYWSDIGTLPTYLAAHADLLRDHARWDARIKLGARAAGKGVRAAPGARMDPSATARGNVFLGRGCRVGAGVVLEGFVCVGAGAVVEDGARVVDSILHARSRVGAGGRVESSVVGEGARIGRFCSVGPGMAVAAGSSWGGHSRSFDPLVFSSLKRPLKTGKLPQ